MTRKDGRLSPGIARRRFLQTSLAGVASPTLIGASALGRDGLIPPSERIVIGMFGVGNRGSSSLRAMQPLPDHQVVAIADCRRPRAELAQKYVNGMYAERSGRESFQGCEIYNDFRDVLARDDVDAIWGCVPDHWHGIAYSRVIEAGKDLYGEKPVTRWVDEGVRVRNAVRRYGCVFQTGTQQRSDPKFRHACELARNGYLGNIHAIRVGAPGGRSYPVETPSDPPEGFDYDMWTGPAPMIPFDKKRCEWLAMYMISHYCAGFITNWGVHHLDIAGWGCPQVFEEPFTIGGTGVLPSEGMTDTWISWRLEMRWADGLVLDYSNSDNPNKQGCLFEGDEGWVHVNRQGIQAQPLSLLDVRLGSDDEPLHASPADSNPYTSHTADFFHSIRSRQDPVSPIEEGHAASTLGNVSDIALRLGRELTWNPQNDRFINDENADLMLSRAHRAPWTI
jgi:predicted dehydrogenase